MSKKAVLKNENTSDLGTESTSDIKDIRVGFNGAHLKLLGALFMLIDHIGYALFNGNLWFRCVGRLAFPIFAFQISEGFIHTRSKNKYMLRLLIAFLISEVPYDLFNSGKWIDFNNQNVMLTLLLGLVAIDYIQKINNAQNLLGFDGKLFNSQILIATFIVALVCRADYGIYGVLTVVIFYIFREIKVMQAVCLIVLFNFLYNGLVIGIADTPIRFTMQSLCVIALIPIWIYLNNDNNHKHGRVSKLIQYGTYLFYPLHLLILYMIKCLFNF